MIAKIDETDFDLRKIVDSGQCFRARALPEDVYRFIYREHTVDLCRIGPGCYRASCDPEEWERIWVPYFDLARDYAEIREKLTDSIGQSNSHGNAGSGLTDSVSQLNARCNEGNGLTDSVSQNATTCGKDSKMTDSVSQRNTAGIISHAIEYGRGIRILRQDPWEMLLSAITSQRRSIPSITHSVELLADRWGSPINDEVRAFPTPDELSLASLDDLAACGLGYRAPYIYAAIREVHTGMLDLEEISLYNDDALMQRLMQLNGVGVKVASCVALFAYARLAIAPVDVHIARFIKDSCAGVDPFPGMGRYAGIGQQYIFYYQRGCSNEGVRSK